VRTTPSYWSPPRGIRVGPVFTALVRNANHGGLGRPDTLGAHCLRYTRVTFVDPYFASHQPTETIGVHQRRTS